jgi:hypothetical protein
VRGVTDLISRIAARAVGAPALAQPRVAAPLVGEGGLEVVDEEVIAPGAAPAPVAHVPAAPVPAAGAAPRASDAPRDIAAEPMTAIEVQRAAASPGPAAEELPRHERSLPAPERASTDPIEAELGVPSAEPRAAATAVPVPVTPAAPVVIEPTRAPVPGTVASSEEPPPVRVHIGRLEVRANVQEQARQVAPLPQPAEPEGLSLSDYLRGRR